MIRVATSGDPLKGRGPGGARLGAQWGPEFDGGDCDEAGTDSFTSYQQTVLLRRVFGFRAVADQGLRRLWSDLAGGAAAH